MELWHKFGARKTVCSMGHPHPSALEASVCQLLRLREKAGEIRNIKWIATVHMPYGVTWKCDFSFEQNRSEVWLPTWAEAKGVETADYRIKIKMWENGAGPGPIEIWKGSYRNPTLAKVVIPRNAD